MQPGLLRDLADRGDGGVLAPVELALGEGPVVVRRPVHEQHLSTLADDDRAGGEHVPGLRHGASVTPLRDGQENACATDGPWSSVPWPWSAIVAGGLLWWRVSGTTELERAVGLAPSGAERLSWTDWQGIRSELDADLSAESSTEELTGFLDDGFDADLTSGSALLESATTLHERFGFSPPTSEWELLSQSEEGAAVTVRLPDSADFDELADGLEELGYTRPDDEDGVWRGGSDLLPEIGSDLTPELQYVALDADERLVPDVGHGELPRRRARGPGRPGRRPSRRWSTAVGRAAVGGGLHRDPGLPGAGDVAGRRGRPGGGRRQLVGRRAR